MTAGASVIVPTYRRRHEILRCIRSLCVQIADRFEIVVVDNACDEQLAVDVGVLAMTAPVEIRYQAEPRLGLHYARHAGARAATRDLLLFVDDDAVCDPGWVGAYIATFAAHPDVAAAGGPIVPQWETPPPAWLRQLAERSSSFAALALMEPYDEFTISEQGFFYGANMAIRRDILFALGGFNPEAYGGAWLGDGETGLNHKLWERAALVAYVPEARVIHCIPRERMTLGYLRHRMRNQGAADVYTRLHGERLGHRRLLRLLAYNLRHSGRLWIRSAMRWRDPDAIDLHIAAAQQWGEATYLSRLLLHRRLRDLVARERWLEPLPGA